MIKSIENSTNCKTMLMARPWNGKKDELPK